MAKQIFPGDPYETLRTTGPWIWTRCFVIEDGVRKEISFDLAYPDKLTDFAGRLFGRKGVGPVVVTMKPRNDHPDGVPWRKTGVQGEDLVEALANAAHKWGKVVVGSMMEEEPHDPGPVKHEKK